ncbi:N(4)-(beta-N-acetylglucosaminyl)-L-asparaginase [Candidatus Sumerlaeota bacterium]|nr:N(4)-(beta-N-acetylglucosaminyl)-L-asparaginase [Candidatus Sumerlaeota bacterium]
MSKPVAIATWRFGLPGVKEAGEALGAGGSALDAVERGIRTAELDPEVASVGYGGYPNAAGVVQTDAAIHDGRTHGFGAVAALEGVRTPISVARRVMERCPHSMLAGAGAREFAQAQGFALEELLTEGMRRNYEEWLRNRDLERTGGIASHDTIGLVALDAHGDLCSGCSTSGLRYKSPGRVGDSPLSGCGLYCDNAVGGAAATGNGDDILRFAPCALIVEFMRSGAHTQEACRMAVERIMTNVSMRGKKEADINFIALRKDGEVGVAATRAEFHFAVWTPETGAQLHVIQRACPEQEPESEGALRT